MTIDQLKAKLNEIAKEKSLTKRIVLCRKLLITAIAFIYEKAAAEQPEQASLLELIDSPVVTTYVNDGDIISSVHYVRILGMNAEHGRKVRPTEAKLAFENISFFIGLIDAKEKGTLSAYHKPPYMSEAATRKLYVDLYLNEAGWEIVDTENLAMPAKAGIEIEVQGMPNAQGKGFCDYVLYGLDAKPLAIVEVKKTSVSPEKGRHQVDLYAECMKKAFGYKPVMYYTNGYVTRIIDGRYPDRDVLAFHSREELELMIQRRSLNLITDMRVNEEITNRPYQRTAITSICEWLNAKHRRGLLVMATGTGKTRVAISLVDVLARNNWVKTVLFLADRTSLVHQAKVNFAKLLPNMSICELSGKGSKDYNARLMFCTYQTMINYIDAEDKRFTTGRFDLIIIDEAHRSIFNKYGTIFKYFDSYLIGLTATPKNEVDANTYKIFGCEAGIPNFDYPLQEAISEKYLVGYRPVARTSKLLKEGIDYSNLTSDEKQQLEKYLLQKFETVEYVPTPDFVIPGNDLFKVLYNKQTCRLVLEDLMRSGLRVNGGETIGKTIIFAYNHKHAQMLVDCFHEMYPEYPANTCQLIDNYVAYGDDLILKFGEDPEFRIAVSVDMLDTGVDIPSVLNLVFFKKVRSKIKFIQMIGRGTRLCENIYGPGKHKKDFLINDYCANFEYFNQKTEGAVEKESLTISQRHYQARLDILYELQNVKYQEDTWSKEYYNRIKTELHNEVVKIKSHSNRIQVRSAMQYVDKYYDLNTWTSLSPVMVKEIKLHLTPLLDSGLYGSYLAMAFDVRMYYIEHALLATNSLETAAKHVKNVRLIAKYLLDKKATVPQVLAKAEDLRTAVSEEFWKNATLPKLEAMRISLRSLMEFLEGHKNEKFEIDITDEMGDSTYQPDGTFMDIRTYREKVIDYLVEHSDNPVIKKIHNLEPINHSDLMELEHVLWHELGSKEDYEKEIKNKNIRVMNLAVFVRSLIGLNQEAVNEKFGEYLSGNILNSQQQEFVKTIINYVRQNGDVEIADLVNTPPFDEYDLHGMFGSQLPKIVSIVGLLHDVVVAV